MATALLLLVEALAVLGLNDTVRKGGVSDGDRDSSLSLSEYIRTPFGDFFGVNCFRSSSAFKGRLEGFSRDSTVSKRLPGACIQLHIGHSTFCEKHSSLVKISRNLNCWNLHCGLWQCNILCQSRSFASEATTEAK